MRSVLDLSVSPETDCPSNTMSRGPKYSTTTRHHTTTSHVDSRMLPGVTRMKCVSTETPREDSDRSARATHCEQRLQLREQKTPPEVTRFHKKRLCSLSLARVAFKLRVVVKWSGYVQQGTGVGTGVQLLTVEQQCLLLEADTSTLRFKTCSHYSTRRLQVRFSKASLGSQ